MPSNITELLEEPVIVMNLGLQKFAQALEDQKVEVTQVDWVPPAGGDQEMLDLLEQLL